MTLEQMTQEIMWNTNSMNQHLSQLSSDLNTFAYHIQNIAMFIFVTIVVYIFYKMFGMFFDRM